MEEKNDFDSRRNDYWGCCVIINGSGVDNE
jgi:hypothetical protein